MDRLLRGVRLRREKNKVACAELQIEFDKGFRAVFLILRYSNLAIFHPPFVAVAEVVEVGAECLLLLPSIHQGP